MGIATLFFASEVSGRVERAHYYGAIGVGIFLILAAAVMISGRWFRYQRLVLDEKGILEHGIFSKRHWKWTEVGTFSVASRTAKHSRLYFAVAYTDENHDLLKKFDGNSDAGVFSNDVNIPLASYLPLFGQEQAASELVVNLNDWRGKYGAPEIDVTATNPQQDFDELSRKNTRNRRNGLLVFGLAPLVFGAITIFFLWWTDN